MLPSVQFSEFEQAVTSLTASRFKREEIQSMWYQLTEGGKLSALTKFQFRANFDMLNYHGQAKVRTIMSAPVNGSALRTTIKTESSSSSTWNQDILEKLRQIIKTSPKSFEDIFKEFDSDGNGTISQTEFRNALRKLNLGLTLREIDKVMAKMDTNQDGKIDWVEFISKFKTK